MENRTSTGMRTPPAERVGVYEGEFESAHRKARENEFTGVLSLAEEAFVVFLDGIAVYARGESSAGERTLSELDRNEKFTISASPADKVEMFLTYIRYINDEAVLEAEPFDGSHIEATVLEDVLIDGVRKDRAVSWRGEKQDNDKSILPEGKVTAFARSYAKVYTHVSENGLSGYAVRSGEVATFIDGENVDRKQVDVPNGLIRCGRWTLIEPESPSKSPSSTSDPDGDTESETEEDSEENGGLFGGVFSGVSR